MHNLNFPPCPICDGKHWKLIHNGQIRNGMRKSSLQSEVRRCADCGVDRLSESTCLSHSEYVSENYRTLLEQNHVADKHFESHDELAKFTLDTLWPYSFRGKIVADVGCGGGALLDHISGLADTLIAIEPSLPWAQSLTQRGYKWYASITEACSDYYGKVDLILSTQVIEHVDDPKDFLIQIGKLLSINGIAIISTPNRDDILMELIPDSFPNFFYRSQHRWYFDAKSLATCTEHAGLSIDKIRHVHRYGMANAMYWLKDGLPKGRNSMHPLDDSINSHWKTWLENNGKSDNLYIMIKKGNRKS